MGNVSLKSPWIFCSKKGTNPGKKQSNYTVILLPGNDTPFLFISSLVFKDRQ